MSEHGLFEERDQRIMDIVTSAEIDRRISHSETRIKNWVIAGVLANVVALILMAVPLVYYLGGINAQITQAGKDIQAYNDPTQKSEDRSWKQKRELWETRVEAWMISQGYNVPPGSR